MTTLEHAKQYLACGWMPVPIPKGVKKPVLDAWPKLRLAEPDLAEHFSNDCNIGLILGEPSNNLVDADLDCDEARELAPQYLPPTPAKTGRPSAIDSHWWYTANVPKTRQFRDPVTNEMIVELRSTGGQTVVGPSVHPSGEQYTVLTGEPGQVAGPMLQACVEALYRAVLERRYPDGVPNQKNNSPAPARTAPCTQPADKIEERAVAYLDRIPSAISGQGGHNQTYAAAVAVVHGFGIEPDRALELLLDHYNPRCQPPWTEKELQHKVDDAATKPHNKPYGWLRDAERAPPPEPDDVDISALLPPAPPDGSDDNAPADPGPIPESLLHVPGFVERVMDYTLATAPYPQGVMAFCGALSLQALLAGRKVRDAADNRTVLYLLGLANTGVGKNHPRKVNKKILNAVDMTKAYGGTFASGEGIEDNLYASPAMLFQTDEIDGLITAIHKGGDARYEGIMNVLLKLYTSADSVYAMRVKAGKERRTIDQPCLCIFGTAIPANYYEALSMKMLTNGFFARMLIVEAGKRGPGQDPQADDLPKGIVETAGWWANFKPGPGNLEKWHPVPAVVPYTPEATEILGELRDHADAEYKEAEAADDQAGMAIWARANEKARRLALVYACSENHEEPTVGEDAAQWAWDFVDHQTRRMLFMAAGHVAENEFHAKCNKLIGILRDWRAEHGNEWMPFWRISRKLPWTDREHDEVRTALLNQEVIQYEEVRTRGRPARRYRLA
ncbi:MAG: bifunctional DNA primase/polymerase [Planctomycetota bacterium]